MKRMTTARVRVAAAALVILVFAAACSDSSPDGGDGGTGAGGGATGTQELSGSLTFFGYEDAFEPALLEPFEQANPDLDVRTAAFSSGDETVAKLQSGFEADVVNVCVEDTKRMVAAGLLQPIDTSRITNWDSMFAAFKDLDGVSVDGQVYLVPMVGGSSGIMYNTDEFPDGIGSYADVFSEANAGKIGLDDDPLSGIAVAAMALGFDDPMHLTDADLAQVQAWLIEKKPLLRSLYKGDADVAQLFSSGEITVAVPGYKGSTETLKKDGAPAGYAIASEGQLTWTCGYSIGANAQNVDAAYALINHYSQPETQAWQAENFFYLVSNEETLDAVSDQVIEEAGLRDPESFQNAIPYSIPDNYDAWQVVWRQFKAA
jgi:spermidine/putrescine transport system substrate-binding protein